MMTFRQAALKKCVFFLKETDLKIAYATTSIFLRALIYVKAPRGWYSIINETGEGVDAFLYHNHVTCKNIDIVLS